MNKPITTSLGTVHVLNQESIFEKKAQLIEKAALNTQNQATVALTGGSTPKAFYKWAAQKHAFDPTTLQKIIWTVSDERWVPTTDPQSNFGNALTTMLDPLNVLEENTYPWPTQDIDPQASADQLNAHFAQNPVFNLCFLGMGDDGHTASIFPESPLLKDSKNAFECIDVPEKGMRLTITPKGLAQCESIVVIVTGTNKMAKIKQVFEGPKDPTKNPIQLLESCSSKVTWLLDTAAASELDLKRVDLYAVGSS